MAVRLAEAPGPVAVHVPLGLARRDPLGDGLADPAGAAEPVQREPGRHPEPGHAWHRAEQRVAVGCHRVGMAHERDHAGVVEEREPPRGTLHQLGEPLVVGRKRHPGVIPRHAVHPARDRVRLVPAEEDAARLRPPVDQVVGVAEAGHVAVELVARDRVQGDVLVVDGDGRREGSRHRRHLRRPHPAGVHDQLRLDPARLGRDRLDAASGAELDPGHGRVGEDARAEVARRVRERVGGRVGVDAAVALDPHRAVQRLDRRGRHERNGLLRADHLDVEPDAARPAGAAAQLDQALGGRRDAQAADAVEHAEPVVELDAVAAKRHHRRRRVELGDEPRGVARGAAGELVLLDQERVADARRGQVIGNAAAGHAAADHDHVCPLRLHRR